MTNNNNQNIINAQLNSTSQASALAPVKNDKSFSKNDHFKTSDIELYFQRVIGKKQLDENQTIRLTYDSYRYDADSNGHIMGGVFTYKRQISSVSDLLKFMDYAGEGAAFVFGSFVDMKQHGFIFALVIFNYSK